MGSDSTGAKILVYDGDCRMCTQFSRVAERRWLVGDATRRPADSFEGEDLERLMAAGVHNEMAVIDTETREIRTGYDGILWLMRAGSLRWLAPLFARGPLAWLGRHDYRTVAYNRRIISPPGRSIACACDPDLHVGYRWNFIVLCLAWMLLVGAGSAFLLLGGAWWRGLGLAPAWGLVALGARRLVTPKSLDYLGHTAFSATAMTLPVLLVAIVYALFTISGVLGWAPAAMDGPGKAPLIYLVVGWGLALPLGVLSCVRRLPRLGVSRGAAVAVALLLWTVPTVLGWFLPAA